VILGFVVAVWVIILVAFVVLSAAVRCTSVRAKAKLSAQRIESEVSHEQLKAG
jgi:hypothetical protein